MRLENTIAEAAVRAAASHAEWEQKHHPVRIDGKTYWLSTDIPRTIRDTLDVLPKDGEKSDVKRANQIKTRLSDEELESFELLVKTSGLPQGEYIRGMVLNGKVTVTQTSYVDKTTLVTLTALSSQIGKIAGMLRQTVILNKEFSVLTREDKSFLELQIRALRRFHRGKEDLRHGLCPRCCHPDSRLRLSHQHCRKSPHGSSHPQLCYPRASSVQYAGQQYQTVQV